MTEAPPVLHELEQEVMDEIWRLGEATVTEVVEGLNQRLERPRAHTTVATVMTRLDIKALLTRRRDGRVDLWSATLSRDDYLERRARAEVGELVDSHGDRALVHFARLFADLDPGRRDRLRRLARRG